MKREFDDQYGRTMLVGSGEPGEAYLKVSDHLGEFCPKPDDLVDIAVALWKSAGLPVPVITPRPDVDTSAGMPFHSLTLAVMPGAVRMIHTPGGRVIDDLPPGEARRLAGLLVAYADAAEAEPDPEDVADLASLVALAIPQDDDLAETVARCLLESGRVNLTSGSVSLPGEDGGRG